MCVWLEQEEEGGLKGEKNALKRLKMGQTCRIWAHDRSWDKIGPKDRPLADHD